MVQPLEARGQRSLCTLVDLQDWDAAQRRYDEIGIEIRYHKNRPVVLIEEVKTALRAWYRKQKHHINTT